VPFAHWLPLHRIDRESQITLASRVSPRWPKDRVMRLAASILYFFSSILRLCRSTWLAWVVRQRHDARTLTFPRLRTPGPRPRIARSETIFFPDRYRWWPFAIGPPGRTKGNEMRPPIDGTRSHFLLRLRFRPMCKVEVCGVCIAKVRSPSWTMPHFLFRKALRRHRQTI
jgi:hypothetical protein